jgi:16S rRNA (adenine1518-N6/adenine1519-N6)-dimethyltransferase
VTAFEELQKAMMEAGVFPEKKYSQNFLVNDEIVHELVASASLTDKDHVLEIGGGTGIVTRELSNTPARVTSVEFHTPLAQYLKKKFANTKNVSILEKDFLQVDLSTIPFTKVVAAPPYAISDDIMYALFAHGFSRASLIWQLEFAEKILAPPGSSEYHPLSVIGQYFFDGKIARKVTPKSFYPIPNHFSALLVLNARKKAVRFKDYPIFVSWLKTIFRFKNKTVNNAISQMEKNPVKGMNMQHSRDAIRDSELSEEKVFLLEPEEFVELFEMITQK